MPFNDTAANTTDLNATSWFEPTLYRDPNYIILPLSVIYVVIFVFGLVGNVSTCVVIGCNRQMRTATNYYLVRVVGWWALVSTCVVIGCNRQMRTATNYYLVRVVSTGGHW